jgi:hypothetical protein
MEATRKARPADTRRYQLGGVRVGPHVARTKQTREKTRRTSFRTGGILSFQSGRKRRIMFRMGRRSVVYYPDLY